MGILLNTLAGILLLQLVHCDVEEQYRLPKDIKPLSYKINLHADPEKPNFSGNVEIKFDVIGKNETDQLMLHSSAEYINITNITYMNSKCVVNATNNITDIITVSCENQKFVSGKTIVFQYEGKFAADEMYGFYKSTYDDKKVLVATQFEPVHARRAFPCFDEPSFKAPFQLTITHPSSYNALANTAGTRSANGSETTTVFKKTPKMSTYLLAFIISQFEPALEATGKYNVYARKSAEANMQIAKQYGEKLVDLMSNWTGIDYVKLGIDQVLQVAIPDFAAGAMENWGLITYREIELLDEGNKTSNSDQQTIITVMAHEISHQWFGDYVTLDWWSNTWLNEGFATFFQYHLANLVDDGTMELEKQFVTDVLQTVFLEDALPSSQPLSSLEKEINSPVEDNTKFDDISYSKGGCIVRMMKFILGDDTFQKGLNSYLNSNHHSNTNPDKLLKSLQEAAGNKVENFPEKMHNWIHMAGFPLLTVTQKNDSTVIIKQERFISGNKTEWYVPLSYTDGKEKNFSVEIKGWLEPNQTLEISHSKEDWMLLNIQQSGFYRVNYDDHLWSNIIKALKGNDMKSIDSLNRAQLIDDIFNLARVGKVKYQNAFELVRYLKTESEYYPWNAAFNAFKYLIQRVDNETEKLLKSMILELLTKAFPKTTSYTTHVEKLKEELVLGWACKVGQEECLNYAKKTFQDYKKNTSILENSKRQTVFCYGLKTSDNVTEDYDFLFGVFKNSTSSTEQNVILASLGCVENEDILSKYLALTITEKSPIRQQDYATVFTAVSSNHKLGVDVALKFLRDNFMNIEKSYGGVNVLSSLVTSLANKLTTDEQIRALTKIIQDHKESSEQIKVIEKKVNDVIDANEKWQSVYGSDIKKVLKSGSVQWNSNVAILVISTIVLLLNL